MTRVLHVAEPVVAGVPNLVRDIQRAQVRRGDEVFLLAPPDFPAPQGVRHLPWSIDRRRPFRFPLAAREISHSISAVAPDVVHLHSFMAGLLGRLNPARHGLVPIVYQPHAWSFDVTSSAVLRRLIVAWERRAARSTRLLVTNCREELEEGRAEGIRSPGEVIGTAIDLDHFRPADSSRTRADLRNAVGLTPADGRIIICVGRITRQKGQDLLVEAWKRESPDDTTLVLVGPGDSDSLRQAAGDAWGNGIRAVGNSSDVRPWMWAADALVLPSRYETVALVVGEAMACAKPVVAMQVNGTADVVTGGPLPAAGVIVPGGDGSALVRAVADLMRDPARLGSMAAAGRPRAEEHFDSDRVADRLARAYGRAMATAPF